MALGVGKKKIQVLENEKRVKERGEGRRER